MTSTGRAPRHIEGTGLSMTYGAARGLFARGGERPRAVLRDLDITLPAGSAIGIAGLSGSGKSTLLRILTGLVPPTAGRVTMNGHPVWGAAHPGGHEPTMRAFRRAVRYVPQGIREALNPGWSVASIVSEPLRLYTDLSRRERSSACGEALRRVGLDESFADRRPGTLSGGECARVGLARALVRSPRFIVADELLQGLDFLSRRTLIEILGEEKERRSLGVLLVLHDLEVAKVLCDSLLVLAAGRFVESVPAEVVRREAFLHPHSRRIFALDGADEAGSRAGAIDGGGGCPLRRRCSLYAKLEDRNRCDVIDPEWKEISPGHGVACHERNA